MFRRDRHPQGVYLKHTAMKYLLLYVLTTLV